MGVPEATLEVVQNGLGLIASPPDKVAVYCGTASKGTYLQPFVFATTTTLTGSFGCGKGVKAATYSIAKTGGQCVFIRLPKVAVAATKSSVTKVGTGTFVATVSGTPLDNYEVIIEFTVGGTIGVAGIFYRYSLDGGETYTTAAALGTATTIALTGTGMTVNLTATQTVILADTASFFSTPASAAILPITTTRVDASTSVITATGSPEDDYEVVFEVLDGGTIGVAGITYRYSLDGGNSWTPKRALGTATSVELLDGKVESSGITVALAAGTLEALDKAEFDTTAPAWQGSDALAALDLLRSSSHKWGFLHVVGDANATQCGDVGGKLAEFASGTRYTWAGLSARAKYTNESDTSWTSRLVTNFQAYADDRIAVGAGCARITCPVTGRRNRRPVMWTAIPRVLVFGIEVDPGRKLSGPLSSDVAIHDANSALVEHDARIDPTLHDARFLTYRTHEGNNGVEPGVFITRGNLMNTEGSDFTRIALRRVMDKGSVIFRSVMAMQLENGIFVNAAGTPNAGFIRETDAGKIEREIRTALENELIANGEASGVQVKMGRTDPVLTNGGKVTAEVKITPLGYIDSFEGTISYTNPQLQSLQEAA